jgi:hypothetical protein
MVLHKTRWIPASFALALCGLGLLFWAVGVFAAPAASASGVVHQPDGSPASGAWVRIQTTDNLTFTAADGSFALQGLLAGEQVVVTAWYTGYKVGWAAVTPPVSGMVITVPVIDPGDSLTYTWNTSYPDPANPVLGCGHCMQPSFDEWQHTAHAAAGTNPRFFSLYNGSDLTGTTIVAPGYKLDFPGTAGNCAMCHAPGAASVAPFATDMNTLGAIDQEGVFCEFCHKVGAVYLNPATGLPYNNSPGVLSMRLYRPLPVDQIFFGSLDDVNRRVSYLPLEKKSQFCAPCHQFSFWGTPIYESFREWLESPYPALGIECQTCHMPPGSDPYFVLPEKGGLARDPLRMASHKDLGLKDTAFMTAALSTSVTAQTAGSLVTVQVDMKNSAAGHHFPTDHPGRHLILVVRAQDDLGVALYQLSGQQLPFWAGDQAGLPGKAFAKLLRDAATGEYPVVSYWKQTFIVSDNRLPALQTDTSTYTFLAPPQGGQVHLAVEVLFRRTFQAEMEQRGWDKADIVMFQWAQTLPPGEQQQVFLPWVTR